MGPRTIAIESATVITGKGPDLVYLHTSLPSGIWPYLGELGLKAEVAAGSGRDYCREHLGIDPEVIRR